MSTYSRTNSICLIIVPYHVGILDTRVGFGPKTILANGLITALKNADRTVTTTTIDPVDEFEGEIGRSLELMRRVSRAVACAVKTR